MVGEITSAKGTYKAGTPSTPPEGFKISGPAYGGYYLGDETKYSLQAEFGENISIGGHQAAKLSDVDNLVGIHIRRFIMPLNLVDSSTGHVSDGDFSKDAVNGAAVEKVIWPIDPDPKNPAFTVRSDGIVVNRAGVYEIEGQCPFFMGFGESRWSDNNRTELLRNGVIIAQTYHPQVIGRAGASYSHSGVTAVNNHTLKAVVRLNVGDRISMKGYGVNASYTSLINGRISSGLDTAHKQYRANSTFLTIKMLMSAKFAGTVAITLPNPAPPSAPPPMDTPPGSGSDTPPPGGDINPGTGGGGGGGHRPIVETPNVQI
jgi:hypothetical protein